ncbi:Hypothetical predicted protein [Lynx pardinus]|uniref:Small ribosomal subunit protein uS17 n=1 Tax=Lynx pardinus TaxID=191816 RepID=A0A485MQY2_LYNPA|nr:Hypothetical predicted protein [Lynx pardinus]
MADIQTECTYQKQPTIFQNKTRVLLGETGWRSSFDTTETSVWASRCPRRPLGAPNIDQKCPFTDVSIQGQILSGVMTKTKMQKTIVTSTTSESITTLRNTIRTCPCTCPRFRDAQIGDTVTVGKCWPLIKTVCFNVLKVTKATGTKEQFQ